MKISEVIARVDSLKDNVFGPEQKIEWINELEWRIKNTIVDNYEGREEVLFDGYRAEESMDETLIAPAPWDMVYVRWMEAMIDYYNGESDRYENSRTLFNEAWEDFAAWYHRTHRPVRVRIKYFGGRGGA